MSVARSAILPAASTLFAAALGLAAVQPAVAQDGVGTLVCRAYGNPVPVGSRQPVRCVFVSDAGTVREGYTGRVHVSSANAAYVHRPMTWTVVAPRYDGGMLVGSYDAGEPATGLIGGPGRTIILAPEPPVDRGVSMSSRLVITGYGGTDELVDRSWAPGPPSSDIPSR